MPQTPELPENEQDDEAIADGNAALALEALKKSTKRCYHAGQIEARHPQLYQIVCGLLAAGMAPQAIAGLADMDCRTVLAVRARADAQGLIPAFRETYLSKLRDLMSVGGDELLSRFQAGKVTALDLKLVCDQHELLSGNATVRVAHTADPEIEELRQEHSRQLAARLEETQQALSDRTTLDAVSLEYLSGESEVIPMSEATSTITEAELAEVLKDVKDGMNDGWVSASKYRTVTDGVVMGPQAPNIPQSPAEAPRKRRARKS